jgi:uracil-DNA glycosylase
VATRDELFEELGITPVFVRKQKSSKNASNVPTPQVAATQNIEKMSKIASKIPTPQIAVSKTPAQTERENKIAAMDWDALVADIAQCTACKLCETRTKTVPGAGAKKAQWMVIGEAPGADEDAQGEPFVGRAGKLLDAMLRAVDRTREKNTYVANTLKCRPPDNRNPQPDELTACAPYLKRQIELVQPKLIVTFGKFAIQWITGSDEAVGAMRGKNYAFQNIPVRVTYHPAYLLRSPLEKAKSWQDLLSAKKDFETNA